MLTSQSYARDIDVFMETCNTGRFIVRPADAPLGIANGWRRIRSVDDIELLADAP